MVAQHKHTGRAAAQLVLLVQFYRVEVKVLPPEKTGAPRTRSVLRRFSHFKKLHGRVRAHRCMLQGTPAGRKP